MGNENQKKPKKNFFEKIKIKKLKKRKQLMKLLVHFVKRYLMPQIYLLLIIILKVVLNLRLIN